MAGGRAEPQPGDLIGGHRIERRLGAGAMGTVWLAEHVTLGRRVALKILAHGLAHDPSFQDRFMREARLAARLDHPNVVAVYDAGTDDAGLWLSMRYVEGEDLRRRLNRVAAASGAAGEAPPSRSAASPTAFRRPDPAPAGTDPAVAAGRGGARRPPGGLPPGEVVRVLEGVAAGLDHAHSRGIVHRDVKPGNVLLQFADGATPRPAPPAAAPASGFALPPFQRVLLADFGLTKELEEAGDLTQTGMLLGSADSVAPEQIEGHETDGRVDVYALGSLLYVALTGIAPFPGATMAKLFAHVNGDRPRVSDAFPSLRQFDAVVAAGMAIDPAARPSTAGELAAMARTALERSDVDPQATVAFEGPSPDETIAVRRPRPGAGAAAAGSAWPATPAAGNPRAPAGTSRPTPPGPTPPARMRDEPTPAEPRTRVAPSAARAPEPSYPTPVPVNRPAAAPYAPRQDPSGPGGPGGPGDDRGPGGQRPWLAPALVVGGLVIALVVVLALALRGGDDGSDRTTTRSPSADGTRTTKTTRSTTEQPATTDEEPPATTAEQPPATTTAEAPATDQELAVEGGGRITAGAATRDSAAGTPLAKTGVAADYVSDGDTWRTLVARPADGWEAPTSTSQGTGLTRLRQAGPAGRLILVDYTPTQAASFDTTNVLETLPISGTPVGDATGYRFKDGRIGSIPECSRLQCVDVPLNQSPDGPGWGVIVAAPTKAEAWATVERVARATGP